MSRHFWQFTARLCGAVLLGLNLAACSTLKVVEGAPSAYAGNVAIGDEVRATLRDGRVLEFRVTEVTPEGIKGEGHAVSYGDITLLEKREFDLGRTVALVAGIVLGVVVASGGDGGGDYDSTPGY
ncbi:MAG TPA: hypothetical protein VNL72_00350 [Gammaproteobacteria bacterium]|nr:hypothetical protein [Gammaproteobacteria bacterium]